MEAGDHSAAAADGSRGRTIRTKSLVLLLILGLAGLASVGVWAAVASTMTAGSQKAPAFDRISVFTFVLSGMVYVDPDTSEIVWRSREHVSKTIGRDPWRNPRPTDAQVGAARPWGEEREVVGNPEHNVVAWVETVDGRRGDMVVVEANTGDVLARAALDGEPDDSVVIASVDDGTVYYASVERNWPYPDVDSQMIHVWPWAAGGAPRLAREGTVYFNDMSAGISAIYTNDGVLFEDAGRATLSTTAGYPARTDFGGALSPDGRYWYGAGTSEIYVTETGDVIGLPVPEEASYGWTGPAELTLTVCEGETGACQAHTCEIRNAAAVFCAPGVRWAEAADRTPAGVCLPFGLACGLRMPVF